MQMANQTVTASSPSSVVFFASPAPASSCNSASGARPAHPRNHSGPVRIRFPMTGALRSPRIGEPASTLRAVEGGA
jgi:hypothetical protein